MSSSFSSKSSLVRWYHVSMVLSVIIAGNFSSRLCVECVHPYNYVLHMEAAEILYFQNHFLHIFCQMIVF